jgi:hypothetical protein
MDSYFEPKQPGSFAGVSTFQRHLNGQFKTKDVKNFLSKQDTYTLHKPVKLVFRRRKTFTVGIDDLWQADLADLSALSKHNDKNKYILTCIDVFSKYAWAIPLRTKSGVDLTAAFSSILTDRQPAHLQTDKGTEFLNRNFQSMLRKNSIRFYTSENSDIKASVVERFNRTLKTKMWKYFTYKNTYRYIDVLQDLVHSYNNTYHRSIGMTPSQVSNENEDVIRKRLYGEKKSNPKWKYSVGDNVRIAKGRIVFKKGYLPSWSEEIFKIQACIPTDPVTYELSDLKGDIIKGKFYEAELQRILKEDDVYSIEKVLKTRKRRGKMEYYVKWKGYDDKFNSWTQNIFDV